MMIPEERPVGFYEFASGLDRVAIGARARSIEVLSSSTVRFGNWTGTAAVVTLGLVAAAAVFPSSAPRVLAFAGLVLCAVVALSLCVSFNARISRASAQAIQSMAKPIVTIRYPKETTTTEKR